MYPGDARPVYDLHAGNTKDVLEGEKGEARSHVRRYHKRNSLNPWSVQRIAANRNLFSHATAR
jgi:hypothetical protein